MESMQQGRFWVAAAWLLLGAAACDDATAEVAATQSSAPGGGGGVGLGGAGGSGGGAGGDAGAAPGELAPCGDKIYACGDLVDNDGDDLVDNQDPDCLGACDDTEDHYHPQLPGWTGDACRVDCFWDGGNGPGNDDCYWDHRCDPLAVAPDFPPEGAACAYDANYQIPGGPDCAEALGRQSPTCHEVCAPLTPNGCDCFGCCELPAGSGLHVWLGSYDEDKVPTCALGVVGDEALCRPCTPVPACANDCDTCEYCVGKTVLPPECGDPGSDPQCPPELQRCGGSGQPGCPPGSYCITGCCVALPE
jgi:hypothetical protein